MRDSKLISSNEEIHLSFNISDVKTLVEVISKLQENGLLKIPKHPHNKYTKAIKDYNSVLLAEVGFSRAPRATKKELALRKQCEAKYGPVNWYDLFTRDNYMMNMGLDIFEAKAITPQKVSDLCPAKVEVSEEEIKIVNESIENGTLLVGMCGTYLNKIQHANIITAKPDNGGELAAEIDKPTETATESSSENGSDSAEDLPQEESEEEEVIEASDETADEETSTSPEEDGAVPKGTYGIYDLLSGRVSGAEYIKQCPLYDPSEAIMAAKNNSLNCK